MSEATKRVLKTMGFGIIWVYILSIRIGGGTLFSYANDILVQNSIVEAIDHTMADSVEAVAGRISQTFRSWKGSGRSSQGLF